MLRTGIPGAEVAPLGGGVRDRTRGAGGRGAPGGGGGGGPPTGGAGGDGPWDPFRLEFPRQEP